MKNMKYDFKFFLRCQHPTASLNPKPVISEDRHLIICHELAEDGRIEEGADFFFGRSGGFLVEEHGFGEGSASGDDYLCRRFFKADLGKQGRHEKNGTVGVGEPSHMAEGLRGRGEGGDVSHKGLQAFWSIFPEHIEAGERVWHLFISDEADLAPVLFP